MGSGSMTMLSIYTSSSAVTSSVEAVIDITPGWSPSAVLVEKSNTTFCHCPLLPYQAAVFSQYPSAPSVGSDSSICTLLLLVFLIIRETRRLPARSGFIQSRNGIFTTFESDFIVNFRHFDELLMPVWSGLLTTVGVPSSQHPPLVPNS